MALPGGKILMLSETIGVSANTQQLFLLLWRGGRWANYHTLPKRATYWHPAEKPGGIPNSDEHIYFGVHPCIERKENGRTSTDIVAAINCLYCDIDAKDFSGDKNAALEHVAILYYQPSIIIDSGGGWYPLWLLREPFIIQKESDRTRAKQIQAGWVQLVGGDPGAKDIARILRIPGTLNRKYDPPRPVKFHKVDFDLLYDLSELEALLPETEPPKQRYNQSNNSAADIEKVRDALDRLALWRCSEYAAWRDVGFALQELGEDGLALWDQWSRNCPEKYDLGTCEKHWQHFNRDGDLITIASLFYWANQDNPSGINNEMGGVVAATENDDPEAAKKAPSTVSVRRWTVADLLDTEFAEPNWAIPAMIPEGLTIIGGRPKVGKSWLMLQSAWSVGSGGMIFDRKVARGNVLYLALEDSPRKLKERIQAMGITRDALIAFQNDWQPLHKGGVDQLIIELERVDYRMIVIDTLTRSIPGVDQKKDNGAVGMVLDNLQRMAINRNLAIVMVDHTRKPSGFAADPIDDILHTTEKTAIADVIMALYKEQGKSGATLMGRGRDIEEIDLRLDFDHITRSWQLEGENITERSNEILDALEVLGKSQVVDLAKATGQNRGNVFTRLQTLVDKGIVLRYKEGSNVYYEILNNERSE